MMNLRVALGLLAAISAGGCSETKFADLMGAGKYSSDETQVRTSNNLAMPPDLQLAPPGTQVAAAVPPPVAATQAVSVPPPIDGEPGAAPTIATTAAATPPDNYAKYGISKTHPDGKPKTQPELWKELRAAQLAEKRRLNPRYGTIANIGNIFTDE